MNKILYNFVVSQKRCISTTSTLNGKKNFRKFYIPNKRGTRLFKEAQLKKPHPDIPIDKRGARDVGMLNTKGVFQVIPEKIPQLIVPDLEGCQLKPYVSYRADDIKQSEFTPEDLFNAVYGRKMVEDWNNKKLNEDGTSKEPSEEETMTADQAWIRARQTGSDMF